MVVMSLVKHPPPFPHPKTSGIYLTPLPPS